MRILVIDDEFAALKKLEVLLSEYGPVDAATSGAQAKERFAHAIKDGRPYDLMTIDIGLPDTSGIELLKFFNAIESRNAKVSSKKIMVTGSGDPDDVLDAGKLCDGYITKPVKREVLFQKLQKLGLDVQKQKR